MGRNIPEGSILLYDIETTTHIVDQAKMRFFGYYSYITRETEIIEIKDQTDIDRVKELINNHEILVGFNNKKFDNPILSKYGIDFKYRTIVDLWDILSPKSNGGKGRHAIMKGFSPSNYKLGTIVKYLGIGKKKNDTFNYKLLEKEEPYTIQELDQIVDYTKEDILITRNLFEYLYNYFYSFKEFLPEKDQRKLVWLTSSVGGYAYKVLCNYAGIPEEYADEHGAQKAYEGAFVALPTREKANGSIRVKDVKSAYPHAYMMANLYSYDCKCCTNEEKYRGKGIFKLQGAYCTKQPGKIETVIKNFYNLRLEYKKTKDPREYTIKILINTFYGISGSPIFKSIYNLNTAGDCTYIVREMIKYARQKFTEAGYEVIYTDTDSWYIFDPFNDDVRLDTIQSEIVKYLKSCFPFPQDTFGMDTEAKIKAIFFFKTGNEYVKKNYMFIKDNDEIVIKGLPLIKSNATALGLLIYNKYLKEQVIKRLDCKFDRGFIKQLIYTELEKDMTVVGQSYRVKSEGSYKSVTSLPAKIAKYMEEQFVVTGQEKPDTIQLIPNTEIELGKRLTQDERKKHKKGYCTLEDYKKFKLNVYHIDIEKTMSELEPFIKNEQKTLLEV